MKRISLVLGAMAALAFAGSALAAPSQTPAGYTGACNMINDNALPGMMHAMFGTPDASANGKEHGNAGMWLAVYETTGLWYECV